MADDYATWKEATFGNGYMIWHEGLFVKAVVKLRGAKRQHALAMLQLGMAQGDHDAVTALAAMGENQSVLGMRAVLAESSGSARVAVALAIYKLTADESLSHHLVEVLQEPGHWGTLIDAAMGLRPFSATPIIEAALFAALHHDEYLVRYHAASTLLVHWRVLPVELDKHRELFRAVCDQAPAAPSLLRRLRPAS